MDPKISEVAKYYDENAQLEWERLERHPFEFVLTTYMMDRYIQPGQRILDIGGGPGRYSIHYAGKGCDVTLVDLSHGNIALAKEQADKAGVHVSTYEKNCLELDQLPLGQYDYIFLMGPLYHISQDEQRHEAVTKALACLKSDGLIYVSFIMPFAGLIYDLKTGAIWKTT